MKAGNSCHIHVLKQNPTGDTVQGPAATAPPLVPLPSTLVKHPYDTLRLRTVKPLSLLTKKEAFYINGWRFRKLRAHLESITLTEDETFDRYMQNMLLLEELFNGCHTESCDDHTLKGSLGTEKTDGGLDLAIMSAGLRMRQRSSSKKREAHKQKLKRIIDRSLQKLHKGEEIDDIPENEDYYANTFAARRELKRIKVQSADGKERLRRMEVFGVLVDKLKVVDNQEDFDVCLKTYEENFSNHKANASKGESAAQMVASKQQATSDADCMEISEVPAQVSQAFDLTKNASFKSRLDAYGVMRPSWRVDTRFTEMSGNALDVPLSSLESL